MGTSHGVPSAERHCSSTLIQTNGSAYIIDAGAPIYDEVLRAGIKYEDVRAIFTTHCHGDHINGIFHFIDLSQWYWKNSNYDAYLTSQAVIDAIHAVLNAVSPGAKFPEDRIRLHLATAETKFEDENIKLSYIPTKHINEYHLSAAMDIELEGKRILFTGDMSHKLAKDERCTVKEFAVANPCGTFILKVHGHVVTLVDGLYYDSWDSGDKKVTMYYQK